MTATLWALLLFAVGLLAAGGVGHLVLPRRLFRSAALPPLESSIFVLAAGIGSLAYLTLVVGLLRQANAAAFGILLGAAALVGVFFLVRSPRGAMLMESRESVAARPVWYLAAAAALGLIGLLTAIAALAPPSFLEWDSLAYHLAVPKTYLAQGRIFYIPYDHHSNFPFTLEMLYLLMMVPAGVLAYGLA
ncbi:MAG: hypothetical protein V4671_24475, partial [Armatimonadota bacterium]